MTLPHFTDSQYFKNYLAQANSARIVNMYTRFTMPHVIKILQNAKFYIEFDDEKENFKCVLETITFDDLKFDKIEEKSKNLTKQVVKNDVVGYLNCEQHICAAKGDKFTEALLRKYTVMMSYALETYNKKTEFYLTRNEAFELGMAVAEKGSDCKQITVAEAKTKHIGE